MRCGCSFSLQHWAKTEHLVSYFRQQEEDWHSLVEFSFPAAYWKCAKCCFSECCCILQDFALMDPNAWHAVPCPKMISLRSSRGYRPAACSHRHLVSPLFFFSLSQANKLQNKRETLLCQKPGWMPFPMQQHVPVFQLEAAVVTALSHLIKINYFLQSS